MTLCVMAMAAHVPDNLRPALQVAVSRWYVGASVATPWEPFRIACWSYLDQSNGDSVTIVDQTDIAVRALICVLDEELTVDDYDMTTDFFGNLLGDTDLDAVALAGLVPERP